MATETLDDNESDQQLPLSDENKAADNQGTKPDKDTGIPGKEKNAEDEKAEEETNKVTEKDERNGREEEKEEDEEEEKSKEDEATEKTKVKGSRKGNVKEDQSETSGNKAGNDPVTPGSNRPTRVRKTVERYSEPSPPKSAKSSSSKALMIEKGRGMQLKDIPNVAFKLTKRKPDDNLQVLHSILFGKKTKAHSLKRNIGQFSGYVWIENEEKQRAKVKEKLDKCVKEKLVDFCDVLNIPINKTSIKKEELSAKLLEFLESPHATTDALLSDKNQKGQKRKRKAMPNKASGDSSMETATEKKTQTTHVGKKQKWSSKVEDEDDQAEPADAKDDSQEDDVSEPNEESDHKESKLEENDDEKTKADKSASKKKAMEGSKSDGTMPVKKGSASKAVKTAERTPKSSTSKKNVTNHDTSVSKSNQSASNKQKTSKEKQESKVKVTSKKAALAKDEGKGKSSKKAKVEPSRNEMHAVVVDILKEVDFNTATLSDILRQLGTHFGLDLMHRKAEVKDIITDVINSLSDEDEGEEDEDVRDSDDADKDDDSDG